MAKLIEKIWVKDISKVDIIILMARGIIPLMLIMLLMFLMPEVILMLILIMLPPPIGMKLIIIALLVVHMRTESLTIDHIVQLPMIQLQKLEELSNIHSKMVT